MPKLEMLSPKNHAIALIDYQPATSPCFDFRNRG